MYKNDSAKNELNEQRDKLIVDCGTANIEKMLDSKVANAMKPVSELSGKITGLIQRMGTAKQRISDLENESVATVPRVKYLAGQLQKASDRQGKLWKSKSMSKSENCWTMIGIKQHKILLYADDILSTLKNPPKSLTALSNCVQEFSLIAGYKVHFDKS